MTLSVTFVPEQIVEGVYYKPLVHFKTSKSKKNPQGELIAKSRNKDTSDLMCQIICTCVNQTDTNVDPNVKFACFAHSASNKLCGVAATNDYKMCL